MKCVDYLCSCEIKNIEDCDWECIAQMEDKMDEDGYDLTEQEVDKIAKEYQDSLDAYLEEWLAWMEKECLMPD